MNESIRIRIRKLLALSASPHKGEARTARMMAEKLMKKHNLSLAELKPEGPVREREIRRFERVRQWEDLLLRAVLDYTAVEGVYAPRPEGEALILIGREDRIDLAEKLYSWLHGRLYSLGEEYKIVVKDRESFRLGMAQAVSEKLDALKEEREGSERCSAPGEIVPAEDDSAAREADRYIDEVYGKIGSRDDRESFDPNSLGLGKAVGRKIPVEEWIKRRQGPKEQIS